jgi:4-hydroxy-tetrahydrodipicolinate synthase
MMRAIADGVYPTMVTPFTEGGEIDATALAQLVEWFIAHGVDGLFAVCQSSEMWFLSPVERVQLAQAVVERVDGRVDVVAAGVLSPELDVQADEVKRIADTGVDAVVLVTNRYATDGQPDEVWRHNVEHLLGLIPDWIPLGFYECPYPANRLLSPELIEWCAATRRFVFLKDTSCDVEQMRAKLAVAGGLKLYNAHAPTLLDSLRLGAAGYCGVMGNFHPQLYRWLCRNWQADPQGAERMQAVLGVSSVLPARAYPVCAKYYLQLEGVPLTLHTRVRRASDLLDQFRREVEQLRALTAVAEAASGTGVP